MIGSRRAFLRGAGGIAVGLPFLESAARAQARRKRFVVFHFSDGVVPDKWWPTGAGSSFTLSESLLPLEPHRNELLIVSGVEKNGGGITDHKLGHVLTGGGDQKASIDQLLGPSLRGSAPFATLELGVHTTVHEVILRDGKPLPAENNPTAMFERMFQRKPDVSPGEVGRLLAQRRSVLDTVRTEYEAIRAQVGAADRRRLEAHLGAIREVELRLSAAPAPAATGATLCGTPRGPVTPTAEELACGDLCAPQLGGRFDRAARNQIDLLVLSLACGLTNVATLQLGSTGPTSKETYPWILTGNRQIHHNLAHGSKIGTGKASWARVNRWYVEQFAYLLGRLKAIEEPGGTLLSNALVVLSNNMGDGNHGAVNLPFVLAGSCAGAIRTGRLVGSPMQKQPHARLLMTLAQAALGREPAPFGDPRYLAGGATIPDILGG